MTKRILSEENFIWLTFPLFVMWIVLIFLFSRSDYLPLPTWLEGWYQGDINVGGCHNKPNLFHLLLVTGWNGSWLDMAGSVHCLEIYISHSSIFCLDTSPLWYLSWLCPKVQEVLWWRCLIEVPRSLPQSAYLVTDPTCFWSWLCPQT